MGKDVIGLIASVSDDDSRVCGIGSIHHITEGAALIILMPALNNSVHVDMRAKVIQGVQVLQVVGLLSARSRDKRCGIVRACLISSDEDGNEGESKNLSRNNEFTLTIFPKPAEFVQPAEKALYHPTTRQHNKSV